MENLRDLNLGQNCITKIENLENCKLLENLQLYSNEICGITGLDFQQGLTVLNLSDNNISKVENLSRLPNLQALSLSQNPLNDLEEIQDLSSLPILKKIDFGSSDFRPCNICDIPGYKEFLLTTISSAYLEQVDGRAVDKDDKAEAYNEYVESVIQLQKGLDEIESTHRRERYQIDSRIKENESHLETIQDTLIEELNNLKVDIDDGRERLLTEFEKLKNLRQQSEDTFLKSVKDLEKRYTKVMDEVIESEENKIKEEEQRGANSVIELEFERDVNLLLVDALYTSKGGVVYSEIIKNTTEFFFITGFLAPEKPRSNPGFRLIQAFHLTFSDLTVPLKMSDRTFAKLTLEETKLFMFEKKLPK